MNKIQIGQIWDCGSFRVTITSFQKFKDILYCCVDNKQTPYDSINDDGYGNCLSHSTLWKLIYDPNKCIEDCCKIK